MYMYLRHTYNSNGSYVLIHSLLQIGFSQITTSRGFSDMEELLTATHYVDYHAKAYLRDD